MDLLDFARGPALTWAMVIFVFGVVWRLTSLFFLPRKKDLTPAREGTEPAILAGFLEIFRRMWPRGAFFSRTQFTTINGYVFHIGLAIVVFGFRPHVLFFEQLLGFSWPALPNIVVFGVGVVTLTSLAAALVHRMTSPVLRLISRLDDYLSWAITVAPVATGLMATTHLGARYETLLAVHILSVALLFAWLPFGKLMHAFLIFITRAQTGAHLSHRGARV